MPEIFDREKAQELMREFFGPVPKGEADALGWLTFMSDTTETVNRWLACGDGIAFYRNEDMGSRNVGEIKIVSFGSPAAQLETVEAPQQLPDIGGAINWRFQLAGTYKGEALRE